MRTKEIWALIHLVIVSLLYCLGTAMIQGVNRALSPDF